MTHSSQANGEHALALTKIREWFAGSEKQVFRLFGLAGTGKTPAPHPNIFPGAATTEKAILSAMISQTLRGQTPSAVSAARQAKNAMIDRGYPEDFVVAGVGTMLANMHERGALIITQPHRQHDGEEGHKTPGRCGAASIAVIATHNIPSYYEAASLVAAVSHKGRSGQDHNPFGPGLIVPKPRRTSLAQGNDPLDLQIGLIKEAGDDFLALVAWRRVEQIAG